MLPPLTTEQLDVLQRFASLSVGIEEMRRSLAGVFEFDFRGRQRVEAEYALRQPATGYFRLPEPGIIISRDHISNALDMKRFGLIKERDLVYWATILLSNDAYVLDPADEDLIAEWLNDISVNLDAG
jgi:hypothetical protein